MVSGRSHHYTNRHNNTPTISASLHRITIITLTSTILRTTGMTGAGNTNPLKLAPGTAGGGLSNNFSDLFIVTNTTASATNYLDAGAATNSAARYYRVRLVQ